MSLYNDIRPTKLDNIIGNESTVKSLNKILKSKSKPHTFLFHGERGTGKTTCARILVKELGCADIDCIELNGADNRGIDDARSVISIANTSPMGGKCRVIIWDECFNSTTLISTSKGEKEIQFIKKNDLVFNINGLSTVKNVFINKVNLERIIKLEFSDNTNIYTTKEHLFLTDNGWIKAGELKKGLTLSKNCHILSHNNSQIKGDNYAKRWNKKLSENLCYLWKNIYSKSVKSKKLYGLYISYSYLQTMWKEIQSKNSFLQRTLNRVLFPELCWKMAKCTTGNQKEDVYRAKKIKLQKKQNEIYKREPTKIYRILQNELRTNEKEKSNEQKRHSRKNDFYKTNEWYFKYLVRKAWRKWKIYLSTITSCICSWLENGNLYFFNKKTTWLSNLLQSRYWKFYFENRNRSRWKGTSDEKSYYKRFKERRETESIRLENITFYKRGDNDESFKSIVGYKERNQGFVEFFDLEIKGHPSYFANGLPVHNCHKMTNECQNALLKVLEDTPESTYFILCSTEPDKLLKTVRSRCTQYKFELLNEEDMIILIGNTLKELEKDIDDNIFFGIIDYSNGSPREALVLLEQVLTLDKSEEQISLIKKCLIEHDIIEMCRTLLRGGSWKSIIQIYKGIKDIDVEVARRVILGYMKTVLLNENERDSNKQEIANNIIRIFSKNTFDSGEAGFVGLLYNAFKEQI